MLVLTTVTMDQVILRTPHLALAIFEEVDNKTVANCNIVGEIWGSFIMRYLLPVLVLITLSTAVTIKVIYNEKNNAQVENLC